MTVDTTEPLTNTLDGVLVLDKPSGWTSHDVVAKLRSRLGVKKVGHTGTLDPAATGVLVLCIGRATRIAEYLMATDKLYRATLRLGMTTDTQDATGTIAAAHHGVLPDEITIRKAMGTFVGTIHQVPPMYSAVKVKGVRLYQAARTGQILPRVERVCHIHELTILSIEPQALTSSPTGALSVIDVVFDVVCGKGTYIRTLCADIGAALGVGGHLLRLERRRVGRFTLDQGLSVDQLQDAEPHVIVAQMHSMSEALSDLPAFMLDSSSAERVRHGTSVMPDGILRTTGRWTAGAVIRVLSSEGTLLAVGRAPWDSAQSDWRESPVPVKIEKVLA